MGDAVYESFVRERIMRSGRASGHADRLHREGVRYVRAEAQARAILALMEELSEEEQALVKRARNHRTATKPKNADAVTYKWATAFEALLGCLYLCGEEERLAEILEKAAVITEEADEQS